MASSSDPSASVLTDYLRERADSQDTIAYCALCPRWKAKGTAKETREAQIAHRKEKHPETFREGKAKRKVRPFSQRNMTREREEEVDRERRDRMRMLGISGDDNDD